MPEPILFLSECYVDTALMRTLLRDRQRVTHIKGAPKVGDALHEQAQRYGAARVVVAMVDNDKKLRTITKLKPFFGQQVLACEEAGSPFVVYRHAALATQYLVVIGPKACEGWIYGAAAAAGVSPAAHGLPATVEALLVVTKTVQAGERPEIVSLLKALRREPPPAYTQLLAFIEACLNEAGAGGW